MQDLIFIILMMVTFAAICRKHGTWKPVDGIGGYVGWFFACLILLGFSKWIILGVWTGFQMPVKATDNQHLIACIITLVGWSSLMYWRIPGRILRIRQKAVEPIE